MTKRDKHVTDINDPELRSLDFLKILNNRFFIREDELYYKNSERKTRVGQRYVNVNGYRLATKQILTVLSNAIAQNLIKVRRTRRELRTEFDYFIYDYEVYDRITNRKVSVHPKLLARLERKITKLPIIVDKANDTFSVPKSRKDDVDGYIGIVTNDFQDTDTHYVLNYFQHYDNFIFYIAGRYLTPVVTQL